MKFRFLPSLALAALLTASAAQGDPESTVLALGSNPDWGDHVVTGDGFSVYLYVQEEGGTVVCIDACANTWPPVLAEGGGALVVGDGLQPDLIGTVARPDGSVQLTYGSWPLYRNARDGEPGLIRGQALGGQFFLVAPTGAAVTERVPEDAVVVTPEELASLVAEGGRTFATYCAACHGSSGEGVVGPRLAGNPALEGTEHVVRRIIDGYVDHGMPPFGSVLGDHEIAAVSTFVRNTWGNEFGAVTEEEVSHFRQ